MVPPMEFLFTLWYPKGSKKNWPKCHSGQSVSGQSVTLAKVSLAKVSPAKVTLAKLSLRPNCLWPMCLWPKGHSGQSVILAKVSWPKCLWPKCHSGQSVIQPPGETDEVAMASDQDPITKVGKTLFSLDYYTRSTWALLCTSYSQSNWRSMNHWQVWLNLDINLMTNA